MRRANRTIPVLVEEAEGLLELGDLVVGELVRHGRGGGEGSDRSELEAAGAGSRTRKNGLERSSAGIFLPPIYTRFH
jgi:hypothetical protein